MYRARPARVLPARSVLSASIAARLGTFRDSTGEALECFELLDGERLDEGLDRDLDGH